jgi:hypothetical protein
MYIGDVGQGQLEEIDFQPASSDGGENYGWNTMEGSQCYLSPGCDTEGLVLPVAEYDHSQGCSVTGGVVYRGADYPRMQGMYIYGDYCSGRVWGLRYDGDAWESNLLLDTSYRIVSFGEDEAGDVYLIDYEGDVFLLTDTVRVEPTATSVPTASATPTETPVGTDTPTATPTPSRTPPPPRVVFLPVILKQWQGT